MDEYWFTRSCYCRAWLEFLVAELGIMNNEDDATDIKTRVESTINYFFNFANKERSRICTILFSALHTKLRTLHFHHILHQRIFLFLTTPLCQIATGWTADICIPNKSKESLSFHQKKMHSNSLFCPDKKEFSLLQFS